MVAVAFAKEGANIVISYLYEDVDAVETKQYVERYGTKCVLIKGDISKQEHCSRIIKTTVEEFGKIDILVNNAGVQFL